MQFAPGFRPGYWRTVSGLWSGDQGQAIGTFAVSGDFEQGGQWLGGEHALHRLIALLAAAACYLFCLEDLQGSSCVWVGGGLELRGSASPHRTHTPLRRSLSSWGCAHVGRKYHFVLERHWEQEGEERSLHTDALWEQQHSPKFNWVMTQERWFSSLPLELPWANRTARPTLLCVWAWAEPPWKFCGLRAVTLLGLDLTRGLHPQMHTAHYQI